MKHFLAICLLSCLFVFGLNAQSEPKAPKFGNIDMAQLFRLMPESKAVEDELAQIQLSYDNEIQKMGEEYQIKVSDFVAVCSSAYSSSAKRLPKVFANSVRPRPLLSSNACRRPSRLWATSTATPTSSTLSRQASCISLPSSAMMFSRSSRPS